MTALTLTRTRADAGSRRTDRYLSVLVVAVGLVLIAAVAGALAGFRVMIIQSGSMTPTLRAGDLVVCRSEPVASVRPGEIVTFHHPALHALVTHRVVAVRRTAGRVEVVTKGDANTAAETWQVPQDGRVGRMVLRIPGIAPESQAMVVRIGSVSAIVLAGGLLTVWLMRRIWRAPDPRSPARRPASAAGPMGWRSNATPSAGGRIGACPSARSPSSPAPPAVSVPRPPADWPPRATTSSPRHAASPDWSPWSKR